MRKFMLIGILLGCGDSPSVAVDASQVPDARTSELVGLVGHGDVVQLADQDASADAAELVDAAAELELEAGVDAAQVDAGPVVPVLNACSGVGPLSCRCGGTCTKGASCAEVRGDGSGNLIVTCPGSCASYLIGRGAVTISYTWQCVSGVQLVCTSNTGFTC